VTLVGDDQPFSDLAKQLEKCRGKWLELSSAVSILQAENLELSSAVSLLQTENSDLLMRVTALENWRRVWSGMRESEGMH